ncbi:MAG: acetate--CoA ligase family protein, partial [Anaerolineales bacterium]|nr:acetate--CoA ligase family protein [Anaerolineales bacterium]
TNAGGPGILALDALEEAGLELAPLTDETKAYLQQRVFPAASVENPVDILAGAGPATYAICLDALLSDETVDAVVVLQAPQDWFMPVSVAEVVGEVANSPLGRHKPILTALMGLASTSEATQVLHQRKVPNFAFPERLGSTLRAMWDRRQWLDALDEESTPAAIDGHDLDTARMVIEASGQIVRERTDNLLAGASWMPADQVEALLNAYNIRTPRSGMAPNLEQALSMAKTVGYPVALKLASEGVSHKTDVGGVVLNINSPVELDTAFNELMAHLKQRAPQLTIIGGVYVQQMIRGDAELIVGVVRDPQFGPLVMAGTGGTQVELTRDVAFELAPLTRKQANSLLDRTAAHALLAGYRGAPPADREAAVDAIINLAQIAIDWPEISEIEVNPLIVMGSDQGVYAVDARVRMVVD